METMAKTANLATFSSSSSSDCTAPPVCPLKVDSGDPVMFEEYWRKMGKKVEVTIRGDELLSYVSRTGGGCWYLLPELEASIRCIHRLVENAAIEGRHIVVGNGSTQLAQAALYALSSDSPQPLSVVCAVPYYSGYPDLANLMRWCKWEGDANTFDKDTPFVEIVTSPNNPDGFFRVPVVKPRPDGHVVYDMAYYWPQYTAITHQADHDIMLFTFSKATGHGGSRIGWAVVKDKEKALKMAKFIDVTTLGVSREAQVRASKILGAISDVYEGPEALPESDRFFEYFRRVLNERMDKLRESLRVNEFFSLPEYPLKHCLFTKGLTRISPGFAFLKCEDGKVKDACGLLRSHNIIGRGGPMFGMDDSFVRVSLLSREDTFNCLLKRLSAIGAGGDIAVQINPS